MKLFTSIGLFFILGLAFLHTKALNIHRSLKHGERREAEKKTRGLVHELPDLEGGSPCGGNRDETHFDPFEMEGGQPCTSSTSPLPQIDLGETGLERKLLGLPGWEYLTVGLVVVAVTGIGGAVAIVFKKCGGLFGRRAKKDNDQTC
ncbi:uncharacterized protein LOC111131357 [Crassostrea virginica]